GSSAPAREARPPDEDDPRHPRPREDGRARNGRALDPGPPLGVAGPLPVHLAESRAEDLPPDRDHRALRARRRRFPSRPLRPHYGWRLATGASRRPHRSLQSLRPRGALLPARGLRRPALRLSAPPHGVRPAPDVP